VPIEVEVVDLAGFRSNKRLGFLRRQRHIFDSGSLGGQDGSSKHSNVSQDSESWQDMVLKQWCCADMAQRAAASSRSIDDDDIIPVLFPQEPVAPYNK
jgi:hypothetical protein